MTDLSELSAQEIGRRLRVARESANIRQEDAARVINTSRPTLVSIEQGTRRVRVQEIQQLANHYGVSVNALFRREAVHTDLVPRFRKLSEAKSEHVMEAITVLNTLVRANVELENILGIRKRQNYPPEKGIHTGEIAVLAEQHAQELRQWLGLGTGPIADIFSLVEHDLGIRLYQRRLSSSSKIAGLFSFESSVGACILINADHPLPRRAQTVAHELGHFYGTRQSPEVYEDDERFLSRDERYAARFGRAFVTPAASFAAGFDDLKGPGGRLTRRTVIELAHRFNISRQACVARLEELELAPKGAWDWFEKHGGISDRNAREVLGDAPKPEDAAKIDADRPVPYRLGLLAYEAWQLKLMTEGQLAELFKISRLRMRELMDGIESEERETDGLLNSSR